MEVENKYEMGCPVDILMHNKKALPSVGMLNGNWFLAVILKSENHDRIM